MACESPLRFALVIVTAVSLLVVFAFNGLAAASGGSGIFLNSTGDISDKYYLEITPAGWTFSIWGFIYAWQVCFMGYGLATLCRQGIDGPLYTSPDIMPWTVYVSYIFTSIFNVTWLFLWDRQYMPAALPIIALMPFSLYIAVGFSCHAVDKYLPVLYRNGFSREAWLVRFLVQNALAFYATWVTIATLLNLGVVLVYWGDLDQSNSCTGCLAVLTLDIVVYLTLDWFVLDKYIRYIFSPYLVLIVALTGSIEKNYEEGATNTIFTIVLLSIACAATVVKAVLLAWRHIKHPFNVQTITPTTDNENKAYLAEQKM